MWAKKASASDPLMTCRKLLDDSRTGCEHEHRRQVLIDDGGPAGCGAAREMEVVWPSGIALRGEVPNHPVLRWLKTVVVSDREKARL